MLLLQKSSGLSTLRWAPRPIATTVLRRLPPHRVPCGFREGRDTPSPDVSNTSAAASAQHAEKAPEPLAADAAAAGPPSASTTAAPSPPSAAAAAPDPVPQPPGFTVRRLAVFSGLILGYAAYYLTRNSLTYTAPVMVADPSLGFSLSQVGTMTSIFPIAYGLSKFVSGILGDCHSPSLLLGGGLMLTAACNLALGAGHGLPWFATMWALNGLMQGVGAPSCARMLTSWFASRERGTYWGLWNVAHNTGGFLSPLVAATAAHAAGWRWGMWAPGLAGMALGLYVLLVCRDTPQAAGFNPVEPAQPARAAAGHGSSSSSSSSSSSNGTASGSGGKEQQQPGVLQTAIDNVLSNPYIWALALTYFCVYVVRQGVTSWTVFYLINEKGVPDAAQVTLAAMRVSGLELGGLVGGLAAGRLSDLLIRRGAAPEGASAEATSNGNNGHGMAATQGTGSVGARVKVVMAYTVALAGALSVFQALPATVPPALQWLAVAAIGFCIYGPQMLIGLCGAELVNPTSVGASQGVLGWVAYLGAANAGVPLSWIITRFGWHAYFAALIAACGVALVLLAPLVGLPSYTQRQAAGAAAAAGAAGRDGDGVVAAPKPATA